MGNVQHAVEGPIALGGRMGVLDAFSAKKNPGFNEQDPLVSLEGQLACAQNELRLRKLGAVTNLRTSQAGHYVMDVAHSAKDSTQEPTRDQMACMTSPCAETTLGQPPFRGWPSVLLPKKSAGLPRRIVLTLVGPP